MRDQKSVKEMDSVMKKTMPLTRGTPPINSLVRIGFLDMSHFVVLIVNYYVLLSCGNKRNDWFLYVVSQYTIIICAKLNCLRFERTCLTHTDRVY